VGPNARQAAQEAASNWQAPQHKTPVNVPDNANLLRRLKTGKSINHNSSRFTLCWHCPRACAPAAPSRKEGNKTT
jgi:hypothetical protein